MDAKTKRIEIYDSTLRDGAQAPGVSLSIQDKLQVTELLDQLGVDYIEGGYPLSNPKDAAYFTEVRKLNLTSARIAAFGMTRRKDTPAADDACMKALLASEAPVVTIVGKSWDLHLREVLGVSTEENLAMIADSIALMVQAGREAIFDAEHFFDGWKADPQFAMGTLRAAAGAGATTLVLCDTNGGTLPGQVGAIVDEVAAEFPSVKLGVHCHNDGGLAVANSLAAVEHGGVHVQGTINGIGERCGNADIITVAANLAAKYDNYQLLRDDSHGRLTTVSRRFYEMINQPPQINQPFVGSSAFSHKGGMHVHAVQRNPHTYEHIDPASVGNVRRILVSELSGVSNIAAVVPEKFNLANDKAAQRRILQVLGELENEGYQFESAEASLDLLVRRVLGGKWYRKLWELDHYRCVIFKSHRTEANTEAIVKLAVDGKTHHTVAEGDGPVDSLYRVLRRALRRDYPQVDNLHLVDYRVSVVNTSAETAAKVRVVIDWKDTTAAGVGSVGVSENIIEASWLALVDAVEYELLRDVAPN
ncbi:MAG: citramalate synthase [Phycisphaerae bacterium]|jgi:2-isopropylmalate synthase|nr:citramalate synthase [Phycisphaerae bacterium]MDP7286718.1 citramalate synthase [Phycisphaerae bacterium]